MIRCQVCYSGRAYYKLGTVVCEMCEETAERDIIAEDNKYLSERQSFVYAVDKLAKQCPDYVRVGNIVTYGPLGT